MQEIFIVQECLKFQENKYKILGMAVYGMWLLCYKIQMVELE